ncbi:MAG TPA: hypothetical protein V6C90_04215 [Coleofasciculaceae cyanobacterium]
MVNLLHQLTTDLAECESQASPGPPDLGKVRTLTTQVIEFQTGNSTNGWYSVSG